MSEENPGCRASIRHPANVNQEDFSPEMRVLSHGIDTLLLSIEVNWRDTRFFKRLEAAQADAKEKDAPVPVEMVHRGTEDMWTGMVHPYGMRGYQWIITGKEYSLRVGNWMTPKVRPSVVVEIRSETLWTMGPQAAVDRILKLISAVGGTVIEAKPSRIDVCADILVPGTIWDITLMVYRVTRAQYAGMHFYNDYLQGITVGKGEIQARIYDKPLEIKQKDDKHWMFDVWNLNEVKPEERVIRVEFQIRREVIRELGIDFINELWSALPNLWAYCTKHWLKFQDNPGKHHTQRHTLPWWELIQNAFKGDQGPLPLIRCKALSTEARKHFAQTYGCLTSFTAALAENGWVPGRRIDFGEAVERFKMMVVQLERGGLTFDDELSEKLARNFRDRKKIMETMDIRNRFHLPDNLKLDWLPA